jgi:hypothetical protein
LLIDRVLSIVLQKSSVGNGRRLSAKIRIDL